MSHGLLTVLIAEDDPQYRATLVRLLTPLGVTCIDSEAWGAIGSLRDGRRRCSYIRLAAGERWRECMGVEPTWDGAANPQRF